MSQPTTRQLLRSAGLQDDSSGSSLSEESDVHPPSSGPAHPPSPTTATTSAPVVATSSSSGPAPVTSSAPVSPAGASKTSAYAERYRVLQQAQSTFSNLQDQIGNLHPNTSDPDFKLVTALVNALLDIDTSFSVHSLPSP